MEWFFKLPIRVRHRRFPRGWYRWETYTFQPYYFYFPTRGIWWLFPGVGKLNLGRDLGVWFSISPFQKLGGKIKFRRVIFNLSYWKIECDIKISACNFRFHYAQLKFDSKYLLHVDFALLRWNSFFQRGILRSGIGTSHPRKTLQGPTGGKHVLSHPVNLTFPPVGTDDFFLWLQ